ncbi:MAG: SDR family NAD(P)-dependent oxidoreductase [Dehalococcoidia bacterium]|nr:SDR family NAD(P)-dependent oxidoreductase [Dehalococcoidia bacterium]
MDLQLAGKRALVTGGSRGIGKAVARALAEEGVDVALLARGREALDAAAEEIRGATGRNVIGVSADTGDDASVHSAVHQVVAALGGVDILVNCAAQPGGQGGRPPRAEEVSAEEHLNPEINVKVMGYLRCAQAVIPYMKGTGWGRIINVSGLAARQSGSVVGSIRNVAVAALTKNLADELGPLGITCTVVHPGLTRTEATADVLARRAEASGRSVEEVEQQMAEGNSVRRIIDAEDIAYVVTMLASPRSIALNGDAIAAGGGVPRAIYY